METVADPNTVAEYYVHDGPCAVNSRRNIRLRSRTASAVDTAGDIDDNRGLDFTVHISVTFPQGLSNASRQAPFPVVLFINGFQMRASFYRAYANRLASWGYVCVQYDDPLLRIIDDATELQYFGPIMTWLREQNAMPGGFLEGLVDLDQLAVAGHSRGGKLAGLLYAEHPEISAAFLVDPVDNTDQTPESAKYPSSVKALLHAGRPFGMLGAGHTGKCNPEGSNYKVFFSVATESSWQVVIEGSGHLQFLSAGSLLDPVLRLLCPGGTGRPREVIQLALTPLVAWLEKTFRPGLYNQQGFKQWVAHKQEAEQVVFTAKGHPAPPNTTGGSRAQIMLTPAKRAQAVAV